MHLVALAYASEPRVGVAVGPAGENPPFNYATKDLAPKERRPAPLNPAAISYNVTFADPGGTYSSYYSQITAAIQAAGAEWNRYLSGSLSLEVEVEFGDNPTVRGSSVTSGFVRNDGTRNIFEQGAAFELRTGTDPNGAQPDARIGIGINYLTNTLWFDPDPQSRTAPIPSGKIDAISVMTHELGHVFVFQGARNGTNGEPINANGDITTFDVPVTFDGNNLFFNGSAATAVYGGPVPLTFNNYGHIGNSGGRPGADLVPDLMNGVVFNFQTRYLISSLDLAIARDSGLETATPSAGASRLLNISTRLAVQTGDNVLIGGFIITGNASKRVIIRGIGPSLGAAGVSGALGDPTLELRGSSGIVSTNDDWQSTQAAEIQATGVAPSHSLESAIVATLAPGSYTAILRGFNNGTGVGLVEVYDLDSAGDSRLANISTRGLVGTGDNVMIGGIIIGPVGGTASNVLVRALGPSLAQANIANPLADPTLELRNSQGALLSSNDDWRTTQQAAIQATGIPPSNNLESAVVTSLPPGSYTAIMRGVNNGTGVGLIEVYRLQ